MRSFISSAGPAEPHPPCRPCRPCRQVAQPTLAVHSANAARASQKKLRCYTRLSALQPRVASMQLGLSRRAVPCALKQIAASCVCLPFFLKIVPTCRLRLQRCLPLPLTADNSTVAPRRCARLSTALGPTLRRPSGVPTAQSQHYMGNFTSAVPQGRLVMLDMRCGPPIAILPPPSDPPYYSFSSKLARACLGCVGRCEHT